MSAFWEELTDAELGEMTAFANRMNRAVMEIQSLRKELAAFEKVRRHLDPALVKEPAKE